MTALVTPMRDGQVDYDALSRLVEWQIQDGVDGLVAVGTTGESATLDMTEHVAVISHVVKIAAGRVPVVAGAGGNATREALELTTASEQAGADALLHVTPYYNKPTQDGLFRHFEQIARHTRLPIILYNVPSRTSCDLLPDTVERLAAIDNIVAIKEATGSLPRATEVIARVGDRLAVLSGDDATAFPLYAIGARGVISVSSNVAPAKMARMWDAAVEGKWDEARDLHYQMRVLHDLLFVETNPIGVKAALALMGRCANELRPPMFPASPALTERLRKHLLAEGML
ncbi:MAG: 4-hydroxy-tetrahydrodipicolinate synthase [Myxococcales bacterium]|nr:4-hydroxy-tetrahydrodipicolinate synthase [Myxococcales bacterium]